MIFVLLILHSILWRSKKKEYGQNWPSKLSTVVNRIFSSFCDVKINPIIWWIPSWTNVEQVLWQLQSIEIYFVYNSLATLQVNVMYLKAKIDKYSHSNILFFRNVNQYKILRCQKNRSNPELIISYASAKISIWLI